jgi:enoyl-CoA hydratase/carnithine racemase
MSDAVHLSIDACLAGITLARPEQLDVRDGAMIAALISAADRIEANRKPARCDPDRESA